MPNVDFFTSRGTHVNCAIMACYTLMQLEINCRTRRWCLKCVIVYLARDIPPFVMYCVYGEFGSSLLIESTDSIYKSYIKVQYYKIIYICTVHYWNRNNYIIQTFTFTLFLQDHRWSSHAELVMCVSCI